MKKLIILSLISLFQFGLIAQDTTWTSKWSVEYVTSDNGDSLNSIGLNTISVTTLAENSFVALVNSESNNAHYLVGFKDASKNSGRLGNFGYGSDGLTDFRTKWIKDFDQEFLFDANDLASRGNFIFVANNDEVNHSILVFEMKEDSIYSHGQRYKVGEYIWSIDVDGAGRIYVTKTGDSVNAGSVLILDAPDGSTAWSPNGNSGNVLQEFTLPEVGSPRGITVNTDGTIIYVSNWDENKIYCYIGDPVNGYSHFEGFNFSVDQQFEGSTGPFDVGPFGLKLMPTKNLLFVCHDADFDGPGTDGYEYGRIYIANPNSGEVIDTINTAEWNLFIEKVYNDGSESNASGYTSTFAVDFDENFNVYSQSYYGWTVDKWIYDGELTTVEISITSVERIDDVIPSEISLSQNYPNPFNPTTTISFNLNKSEEISLSVFTITGELITNLVNKSIFNAGSYKVTFDASRLASGTYIYKLNAGKNIHSKKMILIK